MTTRTEMTATESVTSEYLAKEVAAGRMTADEGWCKWLGFLGESEEAEE